MSGLVFQFLLLSTLQRLLVAFALLLAGFAAGMYLRRNSTAELRRAPYFVLFALSLFAVRLLAFAWSFSTTAMERNLLWLVGLVIFGGLFAFGAVSATIARARAINIDHNPSKAWLALVPLANLYLFFAAPFDLSRKPGPPAPVLVILGFALIFGGAYVQQRAEKAAARDTFGGGTMEGLARRTELEIRGVGIEEYLKQAAENMPRIRIDSETRLVDAIAEGTTLTYYYQVTQAAANSGAMLEPMVLKANCENPVALAILDGGATLIHQYDGPTGIEVAKVTITAQRCST